jgi:hypothetical protein
MQCTDFKVLGKLEKTIGKTNWNVFKSFKSAIMKIMANTDKKNTSSAG